MAPANAIQPQLRDASVLMRSETLAAFQPSRLSGTRALMNKMIREKWDIRLERMDVDAEARGTICYTIATPTHRFAFIAFSFPPRTEGRTGRIIGQAWDMMCALVEGPLTESDIEAARTELPKLYRGRATPNTLVWGRSNRSMRTFEQVMEALASGRQPEIDDLSRICYLMRNTGLDGNGTFGTRPFPSLGREHPLGGMLQAQLLCGYLMRELSCDLVSHLAKLRHPEAVPLAPELRRYIGVGNGSALGLIFFVHHHPQLINSWITARETAITRARGLTFGQGDERLDDLLALLDRAITFRREDRMVYEAFASSAEVAEDLTRIRAMVEELRAAGTVNGVVPAFPLDHIARLAETGMAPEARETLLSLIVELLGEEADALMAAVSGREEFEVAPAETVAQLRATIEADYAWALATDMQAPGANDFIWYKSATAEEPRRGLRSEVPEARDLGLDVPGDVQALHGDLVSADQGQSVARFLLAHPQHRNMTARIQTLRGARFHTPHANIHDANFVPIDLVRLMNVGIHGIDKTRDFLNRNLRGVLYHGAPTRDDIRSGMPQVWFYPAEPRA